MLVNIVAMQTESYHFKYERIYVTSNKLNTYLEEFCPMFCHKYRGLQQSIKFIIEIGVFKTMLCHENIKTA